MAKKAEISQYVECELSPLVQDFQDLNKIVGEIIEDVENDVNETADPEDWNSEDVRIAIVRVLKQRLGIEE